MSEETKQEVTPQEDKPEETITLTKKEYNEIIDQITELAVKEEQKKTHHWDLFSAEFWDNFFTKILANFVSVKIWILIFVLFAPYDLLSRHLITADNYTSILTIVAPIVIGLREFTKTQLTSSGETIGKIKKLFHL